MSRWVMGRTTASISSWICWSAPPMSEYSSVGRSSTSIAWTLESNSAGSFSKIKYESLLVPTKSLGLSSSGSTKPGIGRKIVCRVEVRTTALRVLRVASASRASPDSFSSSSKPSSASGSKISTTLATRYGNCLFSFTFSWFSRIRSRCPRDSWLIRWTSDFITLISLLNKWMRCRNSPLLMVRVSSSSGSGSGWGAGAEESEVSACFDSSLDSSPPPEESPQISSPSKSLLLIFYCVLLSKEQRW
mmetsp:Transcript_11125/g.26228  ORF Transcript_11125/g.26228 Transcript_11125/m.26228 type:complete len:246 (-) Transcript_11125:62-799(-)